MLPKTRRIPRESFKDIISKKKYFNSEHFTLLVAPNNTARFAVSVSKKVSKKAVIRNKVRRRAYSAIREFVNEAKPGLYLLVAKPGSEKVKGDELRSELKSLVVSCGW